MNDTDNKLLRYQFAEFGMAKLAASSAQKFGCTDVAIKQVAEGFSFSCRSNWAAEYELIQSIPLSSEFRHGSRYTSGERAELLERYCRGADVESIARDLKREPSGIVGQLEHAGEFVKLSQVEADELNYPSTLSQGKLVRDDVIDLIRSEVLVEYEADCSGLVEISALTEIDRIRLYACLLEQGHWKDAVAAAHVVGDDEPAFRIARQCGEPINICYQFVKDSTGLSSRVLYQRELFRSYLSKQCLEHTPASIAIWTDGAMKRVNDYAYMGSQSLQDASFYPFTTNQLIDASDDVRAIVYAYNAKELKALSQKGCRLAACFLADYNRRLMWTNGAHPLDSADAAAAIQNGFWPDEAYVRNAIAPLINFDPKYAKWVEDEQARNRR
jgi:hypothetical protein